MTLNTRGAWRALNPRDRSSMAAISRLACGAQLNSRGHRILFAQCRLPVTEQVQVHAVGVVQQAW
jgi:hypothetical protein